MLSGFCFPPWPYHPPFSASFTVLSPYQSFWRSEIHSWFLSWSLCTYFSLCLEICPPHFLSFESQFISQRPAWTPTKEESIPLHSFIFFITLSKIIFLSLFFYLFMVCFSPLDCNYHEFKVFAMFITVSPEARTVSAWHTVDRYSINIC